MRRGRSRRRRRNRVALYGGVVLLMAVFVGTAGIVWGRNDSRYNRKMAEGVRAAAAGTLSAEDHAAETVAAASETSVEGIDITGLSRAAAEKRVLERLNGITVVWQEETVPIMTEGSAAVSKTMDEIYADGRMKTGRYELPADLLEEELRSLARVLADKWNQKPVNSQMVSYDKDTGIYAYSEAEAGRVLDEERLAAQLLEAVKAAVGAENPKSGSLSVNPEFSEILPERTAAQAKEQYRVIGSFTTKTTSNKNRNENIRLAVEAIDGRILKPGEEFSFNLATGNRTEEKGYRPAGAYKNGVLIEEPGGGVCQVSTTLYNAIVNSGLQATERNSHSFTPSYIQPGQDAMVSFDGYAGPDLKFVNTEQTSVAVRASFDTGNNTLKISIVGLPVLEEGVKVTMRSEKIKDVTQPAPVYEENKGLPAGTEKVVDQGKDGSVWKTFKVVTKDGKVLEETPLHSTTYRGQAAVIQKGTETAETTEESEGVTGTDASGDGAAAGEGGENFPAGASEGADGKHRDESYANESREDESRPAEGGEQNGTGESGVGQENEVLEVPAFPGLGQ